MESKTPTIHNEAKYGDVASSVIMAGDPLRVKFMAENWLESPVLYNTIRGMFGYTGYYKGKRVSVQGHGMGMPSIGIYSYELFNFYGVEQIVRIGTAANLREDVPLRSMVMAQAACTDSNYGYQYGIKGGMAPIADFDLLCRAARVAEERGFTYKVGNIFSSDVYFDPSTSTVDWAKFGVLAVEMEAAALYINAAVANKKALTICTISNDILTGEETTPEERRSTFTNMMEVALEIS